jgi:uncharacterized protein (TIGR02118 family)
MIKVIVMLKRKIGLTQDEFSKYWKETHAQVALKHLPGITKYIQNHPVKLNDKEPPYDGVAELWFKDMDSFRAANKWYLSDEGKILRDDEARFMDTNKMVNFICQEMTIK